jgi:hypothetical protein
MRGLGFMQRGPDLESPAPAASTDRRLACCRPGYACARVLRRGGNGGAGHSDGTYCRRPCDNLTARSCPRAANTVAGNARRSRGLIATLDLVNKVQVIFLICALPLVLLSFGSRADDPEGFWRKSPLAILVSALCVLCAFLIAIPAASLVRFGILQAPSVFSHPFILGMFGVKPPLLQGLRPP